MKKDQSWGYWVHPSHGYSNSIPHLLYLPFPPSPFSFSSHFLFLLISSSFIHFLKFPLYSRLKYSQSTLYIYSLLLERVFVYTERVFVYTKRVFLLCFANLNYDCFCVLLDSISIYFTNFYIIHNSKADRESLVKLVVIEFCGLIQCLFIILIGTIETDP